MCIATMSDYFALLQCTSFNSILLGHSKKYQSYSKHQVTRHDGANQGNMLEEKDRGKKVAAVV